jgi:hypothetical protein
MERCCLALGLFALATHACALQRQLDEQTALLEKRNTTCHSLKDAAVTASEYLRSDDRDKRDFGLQLFKMLNANGGQTTNMCVPVGISVGATCDDHDLPCQLAALDWAMVNIR